MPIFISRFSPDRGLVGLLQGPRARGAPEEQQAAQEVPPEGDTRRATARQAAQETEQAPQPAARRRPERGEANAQTGEADNRRAVDGRDGLTAVGNTGLAFTLTARRVEATQQTEEVRTPERTARRTTETRAATEVRITAARSNRADAAETRDRAGAADQAEADRSGRADAVRANNREAAESAGRADFRGIAQRLRGLQAGRRGKAEGEDEAARRVGREERPATTLVINAQAGAEQTSGAQGTEQRGRAREGRSSARGEEGNGRAAAPPAEVQREKARDATREIGRGLQRDAEVQNSRNAEQSARSVARAAEDNQRQGARQSQTQVSGLQAERRRLQQEMRQTEQQIRQLQSRGAGSAATAKTANALVAGSNVNILAL